MTDQQKGPNMPNYVFTYRMPKDYQRSPDAIVAWYAWFEQLGDSVVDRGNPVFTRTHIGAAEHDTLLGGYSLVTADTLDAARDLARSCPAVLNGGGVEIGELTPIPAEPTLAT
jgi:hypothetical protein